jgi:hypothetical protein
VLYCPDTLYGLRYEEIIANDVPGYFLTTPAQARQIIERVGSDNLFLQMDLYHCQVMRGDLAEEIKAHLPLISHFQIAGNLGWHESDMGEIHYPYVFDLIDELGSTGWVGCAYRPRSDTAAGLGWGRAYGLGLASDLRSRLQVAVVKGNGLGTNEPPQAFQGHAKVALSASRELLARLQP